MSFGEPSDLTLNLSSFRQNFGLFNNYSFCLVCSNTTQGSCTQAAKPKHSQRKPQLSLVKKIMARNISEHVRIDLHLLQGKS